MRNRSRGGARLAGAAAAVAVCLAAPGIGWTYCRTSVCQAAFTSTLCTPPSAQDCGIPLFWPHPCTSFSVQRDGSVQLPWDAIDAVARSAFDAWTHADCGGGTTPAMEVVDLGPVSCSAREYNQSGGNANAIVFRDDEWPYTGQGNTLALTTVTFHLDTGEIYDADMEVNGAGTTLTIGDADVQYDLQSILTHEAGHFLGLAHSPVPDSTMTITYLPGDTSLRDLAPDDVAAICAVYPPAPAVACDPTPRHGYQDGCGAAPAEEGCTTSSVGPAPWSLRGIGATCLVALAWLIRRRRRGAAGTAREVSRKRA